MMDNISITIITVVYNDKEGLERTVNSVLSQTYKSLEYIIVDGGSTDGTLDVIRKYEDKINKWISEPDHGIYDAMNKGIRMASGKWLNFMNAGDVFANDDIIRSVFSNESVLNNYRFIYSDFLEQTKDANYFIRGKMQREEGRVHHQASIYQKDLHDIFGLYTVTKPYTVSDLLFFLSIPSEYFYKIDFPISIISNGGVSESGLWCIEKSCSLRVVYGYESINSAFLYYWRKKIFHMFPHSWRRFVARQFGK